MSRRSKEDIPAAPFAQWLNQRLGQITAVKGGDMDAACELLAEEIGWTNISREAGARKLYRFRKQLRAGSRNGKKADFPTDTFAREIVEEALHCAGVPVSELYPYEALVDEFFVEYGVPRDQARRLADAWIEQAWQSVWEQQGRWVAPERRPSHYCGACKKTTRVFIGVCEECMRPVRRVLRAVA